MSQSEVDAIHDLNTLVSGSEMGISTFQDYEQAACSKELKEILRNSIQIFQDHRASLIRHRSDLGGAPQEDLKIAGFFSEIVEKFKAEMASDDRQLLDYSLRAIDMGIKACQDFKKRHEDLDQNILDSIEKLEKDYKRIYQDLTDLKLDQD